MSQSKTTLKTIPYYMAFILSLVEGLALFFIGLLKIDTQTQTQIAYKFFGGLIVGMLSMILFLIIINLLLSSKHIRKLNIELKKIKIIVPALINAIFLAMLFSVESILSSLKKIHVVLGNSFVGFLIILLVIPLILAIYNLIPYKSFKIKFKTNIFWYIPKIGLFGITLFAMIYEAIFMPIAMYLINVRFLYGLVGSVLGFTFIGIVCGLIAGFITIILYNLFFKKTISFTISKF